MHWKAVSAVSLQPKDLGAAVVAECGIGASLGSESGHQVQLAVTDVVVGYRVTKYRCVRRINISRRDRDVWDGIVEGEMMTDEIAEVEPHIQLEVVPFPQEAAGADVEAYEHWVVPGSYEGRPSFIAGRESIYQPPRAVRPT